MGKTIKDWQPNNMFLNLPAEIRNDVYDMLLETRGKWVKKGMKQPSKYKFIPNRKPIVPCGLRADNAFGRCYCPNPYDEKHGTILRWKKFDITFALTSKAICEDFLEYIYNTSVRSPRPSPPLSYALSGLTIMEYVYSKCTSPAHATCCGTSRTTST